MKGLEGKTAIVTGGSSGIGQAIAIRLGHEGVNVAVNYVGPLEGAIATKDAIETGLRDCVAEVNACSMPSRAIVVEADVSDEAAVAQMYKEVREEFGTVDFLVNNAGIQIAQDSDMLDATAFDRVLGVNLRGSFLCAREQIRQLLEDECAGAIVNISSVHQVIPKPKFLAYSVSKGGMQNLTRTLALEFAGRGIRVNAIGPGATVTPINRAWVDDPDKAAMVTSHIPMGRAGLAEEMAATTAFLLSEEAGYITGQTLMVDGGLTLYADFPRHMELGMSTTTFDETALRFVTAQGVASAAGLVSKGRVFDLAHILDEHVPSFPGRAFRQCLTSKASDPIGRNRVSWIVEYVSAPSQIGTHMDALNHLHRAGRMFGGHAVREVSEQWGTTRNGVETVPQIVTRGLLLDIAAVRGVDRLAAGDVITPADVESALAASGLSIRPGDAVLLHTGWGRLWDEDGEEYITGEPGPGVALGEWLASHGVAVTGCDTWSYGPVPPEDPSEPFVVPQMLNVDHGVIVLENLRLTDLAEAGATEFLFIVSHPKLRGATGAWVAPLAIL